MEFNDRRPSTYWHVSPRQNRESIAAHGLDPFRDSDPDEREDGIGVGTWLWSDRRRAMSGSSHDSMDLWEVRPKPQHNIEHGSVGSSEWNENDPVHATWTHIEPKHLRLVPKEEWGQ